MRHGWERWQLRHGRERREGWPCSGHTPRIRKRRGSSRGKRPGRLRGWGRRRGQWRRTERGTAKRVGRLCSSSGSGSRDGGGGHRWRRQGRRRGGWRQGSGEGRRCCGCCATGRSDGSQWAHPPTWQRQQVGRQYRVCGRLQQHLLRDSRRRRRVERVHVGASNGEAAPRQHRRRSSGGGSRRRRRRRRRR